MTAESTTAPDPGPRPIRGIQRDLSYLWALVVGAVMVLIGLLGFTPNPFVGEPTGAWGAPISLTGDARNILHLVTGAALLYAALGLTVRRRGVLLVIVGVLQLLLFVAGLVSGDLVGVLRYHVSALDQLVLLALALAGISIGLIASGRPLGMPRRP